MKSSIVRFSIYLNIFRPFPKILGETVGLIFGTKILDFSILLLLALNKKLSLRIFTLSLFIPCFLLFLISLSIVSGSNVQNSLGISELWELLRYTLYFAVASFALVTFSNYKNLRQLDLEKIFKVIISLLLSFIILRMSPISELSDQLFDSGKFKTYGGFFRIFPITPNPNWAGLLILLLLVLYKTQNGESLKISLILVAFILLTGSRTAAFCLIIFFLVFKLRYTVSFLLLITPFFFIPLDLIFDILPRHQREVIHFFREGFKISEVVSLSVRFEIWEFFLGIIKENLWFGVGIADKLYPVTDNQYLKWLLYYGLFGTIFLIIGFIYLLYWLPVKKFGACSDLCKMQLLIIGLASLTGAYCDYTQLIILAIFNMGLSIALKRKSAWS